MKEFLICLFVIVLVAGLDIWTQNYTKNSVDEITDNLDRLRQSVIQEKSEESKQQIEDTLNEWDERYEHLSYYIEHDELEKVKTELVALKANIEVEQYGEAVGDIDRSIFILEHINQKMKLQIKNIF